MNLIELNKEFIRRADLAKVDFWNVYLTCQPGGLVHKLRVYTSTGHRMLRFLVDDQGVVTDHRFGGPLADSVLFPDPKPEPAKTEPAETYIPPADAMSLEAFCQQYVFLVCEGKAGWSHQDAYEMVRTATRIYRDIRDAAARQLKQETK